MDKRTYQYKKKYKTKDGFKECVNTVSYESRKSKDERFIRNKFRERLDECSITKNELKELDAIIKAILQFKGYNKKNVEDRMKRLKAFGDDHKKTSQIFILLKNVSKMYDFYVDDMINLLNEMFELYKLEKVEREKLIQELKDYGGK